VLAGAVVFAGTVFLAVEGSKMVYGELAAQTSGVINDAARNPAQGTPFEPVALRAAINIQETGMMYDDFPFIKTGSVGLGAVPAGVVISHKLVPSDTDPDALRSRLQSDPVFNVKMRAALMAQELAKCVGCSKTDQYIVLALAQNDTFVAEGFQKYGWDKILQADDETRPGDFKSQFRDPINRLLGQGWHYGRMRFELREFVAQLRKLQSQGATLPDGVNLDYIECLGNGGTVGQCSH
jgi:hypothetical protein